MNERQPSTTIIPISKNTLINKIKPYTTAIGNCPKPKYNSAKKWMLQTIIMPKQKEKCKRYSGLLTK